MRKIRIGQKLQPNRRDFRQLHFGGKLGPVPGGCEANSQYRVVVQDVVLLIAGVLILRMKDNPFRLIVANLVFPSSHSLLPVGIVRAEIVLHLAYDCFSRLPLFLLPPAYTQ